MPIWQPPLNRYQDDPIFGPLWQRFHEMNDPTLRWEAYGDHEKNHKVYVVWKDQTHAVGFAHELAALPKEKFAALLSIYFGEDKKSYRRAILDEGPVAYWPLGKQVGDVAQESFSVFTGTLADYGSRLPNGTMGTKEAAEHLLKQINEQPERYALVRDGVPYRVKRVWIEEDFEEPGAGRVMVDYERSAE